ncbi:MAG: DUF4878 domain-containing protein [Bacteroidales bacterium]|nr:DUF4878 domain-containing protein [Bacteroidales bacterium]
MKLTVYSICALMLFCSCACEKSAEKKAVKNVAYEYIWSLANFDVNRAEKYASEETKKETLGTARTLLAQTDRKVIEQDLPAKVRITNVKLTSDTTATAVWHKKTPRKRNSREIELRKRNGKWQAYDLIKRRTSAPMPNGRGGKK